MRSWVNSRDGFEMLIFVEGALLENVKGWLDSNGRAVIIPHHRIADLRRIAPAGRLIPAHANEICSTFSESRLCLLFKAHTSPARQRRGCRQSRQFRIERPMAPHRCVTCTRFPGSFRTTCRFVRYSLYASEKNAQFCSMMRPIGQIKRLVLGMQNCD